MHSVLISYQSVWHGMVRLDREPQGLIVGSALHVGDRDLGEVVDPERRREVSGVGQDNAEGGADGAHLHPDEGALAALETKQSAIKVDCSYEKIHLHVG